MTIRSLILTAMVGISTLTLAGCVEGGGSYSGYSGVYVSSDDGPYYGNGYYNGYRRNYYRHDGYRRDWNRDNNRYDGPRHGPGRVERPDRPDRRNDNLTSRRPQQEYRSTRPRNGQIIVPGQDTRGGIDGRGGAP